jgi:hypothetical protein
MFVSAVGTLKSMIHNEDEVIAEKAGHARLITIS